MSRLPCSPRWTSTRCSARSAGCVPRASASCSSPTSCARSSPSPIASRCCGEGRVVATQPASGLDTSRLAELMIGHTDVADAAHRLGGRGDGDHGRSRCRIPTRPSTPLRCWTSATSPSTSTACAVSTRCRSASRLARSSGWPVSAATARRSSSTCLCATTAPTSGTIHVDGVDVTAADPVGRIRAGLGRITEDRRGSVIPRLTVEQNLVLEDLDRFRRYGFTQRNRVRQHARRLIADFDIRAEPHEAVAGLSGGNLQKVLLARALSRDPRALVAAQPTRGLDVGAYAYVHDQLRRLRDAGGGVLLISEDLDELLALADRIVVLFAGRVIGELARAEATPRALGLLMTGHESAARCERPERQRGSGQQRPAWPGNAEDEPCLRGRRGGGRRSPWALPSSPRSSSRRFRFVPAAPARRLPTGATSITPLTSSNGVQEVLLAASPLLLTGLAVAIAFRAGYYNIGAEGQFLAGAIGATVPGLYASGLDCLARPPARPLGGRRRRLAVGVAAGLAQAGRRDRRSGDDAAAQPGGAVAPAGSAQRTVAPSRERIPRLGDVRSRLRAADDLRQ